LLGKIKELESRAQVLINTWKATLSVGDSCDIFQDKHSAWYHGQIKSKSGSVANVHYVGWDKRFDEDVDLAQAKAYPAHTFTKMKAKPAQKKKRPYEIDSIVPGSIVGGAADLVAGERVSSSTGDGEISESGPPAKVWKVGVGYVDAVRMCSTATGRATAFKMAPVYAAPVQKRKKAADDKEGEQDDFNDFLCATCHLLEADDHSDLILCDGPCLQSWHIGCMGVSKNSVRTCNLYSCVVCIILSQHY
jgi:hypothetical protein